MPTSNRAPAAVRLLLALGLASSAQAIVPVQPRVVCTSFFVRKQPPAGAARVLLANGLLLLAVLPIEIRNFLRAQERGHDVDRA